MRPYHSVHRHQLILPTILNLIKNPVETSTQTWWSSCNKLKKKCFIFSIFSYIFIKTRRTRIASLNSHSQRSVQATNAFSQRENPSIVNCHLSNINMNDRWTFSFFLILYFWVCSFDCRSMLKHSIELGYNLRSFLTCTSSPVLFLSK